MGVFTRLAKDTAIYGVTYILARFINYLFVPLYTRVLDPAEYGIYSEIMGYVVFLQVLLTFGLETGFFRFASRSDQNPSLVFSTILRFLFITSLVFFVGVFFFAQSIADLMGYYKIAVIYTAAILAIDSFTAVLFAKLRYDRKTWRFGVFKMVKIFFECFFNFVFLLFLPKYFANNPNSFLLNFLSPKPDYTYIFAAIFCSCIISLILFIPDILKASFRFSSKTLKAVLLYSLPLMIAGLPGVANDFIDRVLFRFFAPAGVPWEEQLGIFAANAKLAVILILFVQMFRYAAEPFFFSSSNQPNIKKVYADVMKYFTAFCMIIFVFVVLYIDVFGFILGSDFRSGLAVVPVLLMANVLLGINQNLSMWYKLSEKTNLAILVTLSGFAVTLVINVVFMPYYGYYAAAYGHLCCYLVMIIISYRLSLKHYAIPYQWGRLGVYIGSGILVYLLSLLFINLNTPIRLTINTLLLVLYMVFIIRLEKINVVAIAKQIKSKISRK